MGFLGNEVSDHYASWGAFSLVLNRSLLPPPSQQVPSTRPPSLSQTQIPRVCHLPPRHEHNNIAVTPSYDYYAFSSWFSGLPFKFSSANLCVSGYEFADNLHKYQCV